MQCKKGIILAGGTGSRLYPMTGLTNKQLLPIFDKPTIYYPLTTLMLSGIDQILIICTPNDIDVLSKFLGDGSQWHIHLEYAVQNAPNGLAEAFIIGEQFIANEPVALILGDNFFHGQGFSEILSYAASDVQGAHLFAYYVSDPERYGVVNLDEQGLPVDIEEKPQSPKSHYAVTGLYFYDNRVVQYAKSIKPSVRGELEITDINKIYVENREAQVHILGRGFVWFDVGTPDALAEASHYVQVVEERQAIGIACPEEVAWRMNLISEAELSTIAHSLPQGRYSEYLKSLLDQSRRIFTTDMSPLKRKRDDL